MTEEQLRGMVWWLASEIAAEDVDEVGDHKSSAEDWVELAERHWRLGLRGETRPIKGVKSEPPSDS